MTHTDVMEEKAKAFADDLVRKAVYTHSYAVGPAGNPSTVVTDYRQELLRSRTQPEAISINVTEEATNLAVISDAIEYLGWMHVNRFVYGNSELSAADRWAARHVAEELTNNPNIPFDRAQRSTEVLVAFKVAKGSPIYVPNDVQAGFKARAILDYFIAQIGGYLLEATDQKYGRDENEVIETMKKIREDVCADDAFLSTFHRQLRISYLLAKILCSNEHFPIREGKTSPMVIPRFIPHNYIQERPAWKLAAALWIDEMKDFWAEGVEGIDIDAVERMTLEHGALLLNEHIKEGDEAKEQVASNAAMLLARGELRNDLDKQIAVGIVNYLFVNKTDQEIAEIQDSLRNFL